MGVEVSLTVSLGRHDSLTVFVRGLPFDWSRGRMDLAAFSWSEFPNFCCSEGGLVIGGMLEESQACFPFES